jgi:chromosome segregation ATPase
MTTLITALPAVTAILVIALGALTLTLAVSRRAQRSTLAEHQASVARLCTELERRDAQIGRDALAIAQLSRRARSASESLGSAGLVAAALRDDLDHARGQLAATVTKLDSTMGCLRDAQALADTRRIRIDTLEAELRMAGAEAADQRQALAITLGHVERLALRGVGA